MAASQVPMITRFRFAIHLAHHMATFHCHGRALGFDHTALSGRSLHADLVTGIAAFRASPDIRTGYLSV